MKTNLKVVSVLVALSASAAFAEDPSVSDVTMTQAEGSSEVTIGYSLANGPAVVTLDIVTNGVSIGGEHIRCFSADSDVFRKVTGDGAHTIVWRPDVDWPGARLPAGGAKAVVKAWPLTNTPDYLVADLSTFATADSRRYYPAVEFLPGGILGNWEYRTTKLVMRKILAKGVTFKMGVYRGDDQSRRTLESDYSSANEEEHVVTLERNYYMGVFPVTQGQFALVQTNATKAFHFNNALYAPMRPADTLTFNHIRCTKNVDKAYAGNSGGRYPNDPYSQSFLGIARTRTGLDLDLPGEAEWEWACRAGNGPGLWNTGKPITRYEKDPNFPGRCSFNGGRGADGQTDPPGNCGTNLGTQVVGCYEPNSWGLYDTLGNVAELCLDWYEADISKYNGRINVDPEDPMTTLGGTTMTDNNSHVARGGSYYNREQYNRPSSRTAFAPWEPNEQQGCRLCCRAGLE